MKPPRLAEWLLTHVAPGPMTEALAGDLAEEFARRQSPAWYWRQVLIAVASGYAGDVRRHGALALRALCITWAVNFLAIRYGRGLIRDFAGPGLASWGLGFLGGAASGFLLSLLHRRRRDTWLLTGAAALLAWSLLAILFLKPGALRHSPAQIAGAALAYDFVASAGFAAAVLGCRRPLQKESA
jgi:hypothetical protein